MCGILVTINYEKLTSVNFNKALSLLDHRGPDNKAYKFLDNNKIIFGHTRLKIVDLNKKANQPFFSDCGRWTLVYNGEIYNFNEIKKIIGHEWSWKTNSDTEVLLAAWSIWKEKCLDKLVGMFAFSIYDAKLKKVFFVRDRFGIKPLYYSEEGNKVIFSSEIKPINKLIGRVSANNDVIRTYLETGLYDHTEYTFFQNILSLNPGCIYTFDLLNNSKKIEKWYNLKDRILSIPKINENDIIEESLKHTRNAIKSNLNADVPVGLNVSGGIDSTMLSEITFQQNKNLHLFTQDYGGEYSELPWVKKIAKSGKLNVIDVDHQDIINYLNSTILTQEEPFGGVFVCGYNKLYENANDKGIKVLLDGNGVDEVFLGYMKYHQLYVQKSQSNNTLFSRTKDFENFWNVSVSDFTKFSSIDGTNGLCVSAISKKLKKYNLIYNKNTEQLEDPVKDFAMNDLLFNKIPRGLRFNDKISMKHSCELRVPYLDHRLVEFGYSIPTKYLINNYGTKSVFRQALSRYVPKEISHAKKRSVQSPQREWLASELSQIVNNILESKSFKDREWINVTEAKDKYEKYKKGNKENSFFIWQWINLELWARNFLD